MAVPKTPTDFTQRQSLSASIASACDAAHALDQAGAMLFAALYAFFQEHQYCGELGGGVDGDRVWMTCTCGAAINRRADDD